MIDAYSLFYRRTIPVESLATEVPKFDIFVSAFNASDRVKRIYAEVRADAKYWLVHPEYAYSPLELPQGEAVICPGSRDEIVQAEALFRELGDLSGKVICFDISGFMRHVLCHLVARLARSGVRSFSVMYSEPVSYLRQEATSFSTQTSGSVRTVKGMAGSTNVRGADHLIISVGYDHKLISEVSGYKDDAVVHPMFGFPSLSADMFQQSTIRAAESGEVCLRNEWVTNRVFAPANDPFATASQVSALVAKLDARESSPNVYLAPLSTKAQALGFALYWELEGRIRGGVSVLLPDCVNYSRETSVGIKRLWLYSVELV